MINRILGVGPLRLPGMIRPFPRSTERPPITTPSTNTLGGVPPHRILAAQSEVCIGNSVRASHWVDAAAVQAWAAGRGSMDVPAYVPGVDVDEGDTHTFRWMLAPRYQTIAYAITLIATRATPVQLTVRIGESGAALPYTAAPRGVQAPITWIVNRAAQSTTPAELKITIAQTEGDGGGAATIESLSVEALPRTALLTDANELGVDSDRMRPPAPISATILHDQIADHAAGLYAAARRTGMVQFARSDVSPWLFNSGVDADLFQSDSPLLGRLLISGTTTTPAQLWALCMCSDSTTAGLITVDNASEGPSVTTVTIPTGTTGWTWIPADDNSLRPDAEDNLTANGLRLGRWDNHKLKCKRTAGAGNVLVATISIYEA